MTQQHSNTHQDNVNLSKNFIDYFYSENMGLFSRKKEIMIGHVCPKCNMEFSDPERTVRHIAKAHQSKKKFECNSCGT